MLCLMVRFPIGGRELDADFFLFASTRSQHTDDMEQPRRSIEYCQCALSGATLKASNPDEALICERCHLEMNSVEGRIQSDMTVVAATAIDQPASNIDRDAYITLRDHDWLRQRCIDAPGATRSRLRKYSKTSDVVKSLINKHGLDALSGSIRKLASEGIFKSEEQGRKRFPDLFSGSSVEEGNTATEIGAEGLEGPVVIEPLARDDKATEMKSETTANGGTNKITMAQVRVDTQRIILSELQIWLEHICYAYCNSHEPSVLKVHECDCPERLSLQEWSSLIRGRKGGFRPPIKREELIKLLGSAQEVVALAGRRTEVDIERIDILMMDCEALAMGLGVEGYGAAIGVLGAKIRGVLVGLAVRETRVRTQVEEQLERLAVQKAEIVRQEDEAKARLEAKLNKYQNQAQVAVVKYVREASEVRLRVNGEEEDDMDSSEGGV